MKLSEIKIMENDTFVLTEMTENAAKTISGWKYGSPYEMYDFMGEEIELSDLMNGYYFPVYFLCDDNAFDEKKPAGFITIGLNACVMAKGSKTIYEDQSFTDIALGLAPENCDKGLGKEITNMAVDFSKNEFPDDGVRLTVEADNVRAVKTYMACGFKNTAEFIKCMKLGGKQKRIKFIIMTKD